MIYNIILEYQILLAILGDCFNYKKANNNVLQTKLMYFKTLE